MIASEGSFVGNLRVVDNTCKAKKILDTKGTLKGKEVSHADPAKHSAPSKIKNEVFKLTAPYNEMETHILKYNNKKLHLYPTNQVAKIFEESSSKGNKELDKQLKLNFENNTLNINLDTTEYFPKAAAKNKKVKIYLEIMLNYTVKKMFLS